jgi:hypothetical protein
MMKHHTPREVGPPYLIKVVCSREVVKDSSDSGTKTFNREKEGQNNYEKIAKVRITTYYYVSFLYD